jgi:hypothetical protein
MERECSLPYSREPILTQMNSVHIYTPYFIKFRMNIVLPSGMPWSHYLFPSGPPSVAPFALVVSCVSAIWRAHFSLLHDVTLKIFVAHYIFFHFLCQVEIFSSALQKVSILIITLTVRDHIQTACTTPFYMVLIFTFLYRIETDKTYWI